MVPMSRRCAPGSRGRMAWAWATMVIVLCIAGCDDLLDDDQDLPDTARVTLTGMSPVDLEVITSTSFQVISDFEAQATYVEFTASDTAQTVPPYEREFDIRTEGRFFIRITNHAVDVADVTLEIFFDGSRAYSQAATMSEGGSLEYSQVFRGT